MSNIVLIGPMGSGKSTVGAALARRLGRPHVDTDHFFVARHGPIREYFSVHGEEAFRAAEERLVAQLLDSPRPSVVSLGGGSVMSAATRELLKSQFVVMLDVTEAQAKARIGDAATRPVLTEGTSAPPIERWKHIYAEREPLYRECADLIVSATETTIEDRAETIIEAMRRER
ncbi:shikimate kinase [Nesterenkonia sphaerica]|uniref:Shikimate kinase n=1 Tax=Nesterenkonia sphaerica TaxID=1804988 RepID=A0A5R9ANC0_9MICC|nr:shikimate kinase [Nesterenkonia sphaerica]TLP79396.1 shikimate kinase [Nesterenkonia sphaerica]